MKRAFLSALIVLCAALSSPAQVGIFGAGSSRELNIVPDGITIADHLVKNSNNNIDESHALTNAFSTTSGSQTVTVHHPSHGLSKNQAVNFYADTLTVVGGLIMNGGWTIASIPDADSYTFTHTGMANANAGPAGDTIATLGLGAVEDGKLRFFCLSSHLNYDDPIRYPGVQGPTHLHLYYGNSLADYRSNYPSLRATGDGTCQGGPLNRTAYWTPAMLDAALNKVRIPIDFQWYYVTPSRQYLIDFTSPVCSGSGKLQDGRAAACPTKAIKKLERGMRAIFGIDPSTGLYPPTYMSSNILANSYTCQNNSGVPVTGNSFRYLHHSVTPSLGLSSDSGCPTDGIVSLRVVNPNCWNGSHTGTNGYDQFAVGGQDGFANFICPATHPYRFFSFTVILTWHYTGGIAQLSNWYLSSDRFNGATFENGETFHWDMFWAWNDIILDWFSKYITGMAPNPYSLIDSADGGPYVYGGGNANVAWAGGPFLRNTNSGGLSGNAGIGDCTPLGLPGKCSLAGAVGLSDVLVDIPAPP